jgi:hypothetical protein
MSRRSVDKIVLTCGTTLERDVPNSVTHSGSGVDRGVDVT